MRHSILRYWRRDYDDTFPLDYIILFSPMPVMVRQCNDESNEEIQRNQQHIRMKRFILPKIPKQKALLYFKNHIN